MARILLVRPGSGSPDMCALEVWQALTSHPVYAVRGDLLGARMTESGYSVIEIDSVEDPVRALPTAASASRRLPMMSSHAHGDVDARDSALAARVCDLAVEHGEIAFILPNDDLVRAVFARAIQDGMEVEVVMGRAPRGHVLLDVVGVVARLRGPGGCPWDAEQTHQSLARHLLEETYELLEAIETGDPKELAEELGDLLFQAIFHAQLGSDAGTFDIDDVASGLATKLIGRHPHVFGDVEVSGTDEVVANWDVIKQREKGRSSVIEGIPEALPSLSYAQKLQRRSGTTPDDPAADARAAIGRVLDEAQPSEESLGDALFAVAAFARAHGLDAETALRARARTFRDTIARAEIKGEK